MDNYRKPTVNRYWKRPKPKVYECNVRDSERFYQQNYKDYLSEKEEAASRAARARSIDTEPSFYSHLRAGPIRKETSKPPPLPPSYKSSLDKESSVEASSTKFSAHETVSSYDPDKETASLDERLARLKKLREELGLPGDSKGVTRVSTSLTRDSRGGGSEYESSYKSEKSSRANGLSSLGGGEEESSYSYKSERSSGYSRPGADDSSSYSYKSERTSGRSRPDADDSSSYSYKSERTSNYSRPGADDSSYSFKSERTSRTNAANDDDYSFKSERKTDEYKPSAKYERKQVDFDVGLKSDRKGASDDLYSSKSSSSSSRARKTVVESLDIDDDDTDVMKMMKKMPSSQDILDRISKMDLDD